MKGTFKSLKIKFHIEKFAISKKSICPCLSLLERSFQLLLFSSSNSCFSLCCTITHAMQQYSAADWRVCVVSTSPQGAHFQVFPALPGTALQQQHGVVLGPWAGACAVTREWSHPGSQPQVAAEARPACPCPLSEPAPGHVHNCARVLFAQGFACAGYMT